MATRSATSTIRWKLKTYQTNTLDSGRVASVIAADKWTVLELADGVVANQANRCMAITNEQIAPGATKDIYVYDWNKTDVGQGLGKDALGQEAVFEEVVAIALKHRSGDGQLELYASVPWDDLEWLPRLTVANGGALKAGGGLFMYNPAEDGYAVSDYWQKRIRVGAVGDFVYFDLYVLGKHDDDLSSSSSSTS